MKVVLRISPGGGILLEERQEGWLEFRDELGEPQAVIFFLPGNNAFLISRREDNDFNHVLKAGGFGAPMSGLEGERTVLIFHNPIKPPKIYRGVGLAEVRDDHGQLVLFVLNKPGDTLGIFGGKSEFFLPFAKELKIPLRA